MEDNLSNYKFLKERDLDVIEQTNSLMNLSANFVTHKDSKVITFLRADSHKSLFKEYSADIGSKFDLGIGDKLFTTQLQIPSHILLKKYNSTSQDEAYIIESDLDMFSVLILGYWELTKKYKFSNFLSV